MTTYATIGQYAVLVGVAGAIYFISQRKGNKAPRTKVTTKQAKAAVEKQKPAKAKKARKDGGHSSGDQGSNEKAFTKTETQVTPVQATRGDSDESDGVNNKEFAKQFTSAKSGTLLPSKSAEAGRQKSVKQSKAQEKAATFETSSDATGPSSAAGGDADDDRSSANSPDFGATAVDAPVTNGGIDDMLEAPAAGPGVLKITAPTNPTQPKKAKTQSAAESVETKKQRQNRKKAEEKKAMREEEEKQRKVALEKQRRTAREAEGRAAKDGSVFMASQAPSSSAWTGPKEPVNGNETANKAKVDLLDTYEPSSSKATASSNSESELVGGDWQKIASTLPEEEQMRRALEESDNWETVKEKRTKKKAKATQSPPQEKSEAEVSTEQPRQRTPKVVKPATGSGTESVAKSQAVQREPELQDSEWDVAGYGDN